jgi:hypothetical protein
MMLEEKMANSLTMFQANLHVFNSASTNFSIPPTLPRKEFSLKIQLYRTQRNQKLKNAIKTLRDL